MKYRTWGKYCKQTVRKDKDVVGALIIRQGKITVDMDNDEIDSLIIALMEMRR